MQKPSSGGRRRLLWTRVADVAIHIVSRDFPRRLSRRGLLSLFALLPLVGLVDSAPAAESIRVTARVLPLGAALQAAALAEGFGVAAEGSPEIGDSAGIAPCGVVEIVQDGAWIRLSTGAKGPFGAKRWVQVVYLGN